MHIEILVEDSSGKRLIEYLVPKLVGPEGNPHTWKVHGYKGVGRIPGGLSPHSDPSRRILLDQLPRLLRGYAKTPGIDAIVVIVDADDRNCVEFLAELKRCAHECGISDRVLFRIAIEEMESWYLGDRVALTTAYPRAKRQILDGYAQDSICGTWELIADAVVPGGVKAVKKAGWPRPGDLKHEWADAIGPVMDMEINMSPSFRRFRDGMRRLASPDGGLPP